MIQVPYVSIEWNLIYAVSKLGVIFWGTPCSNVITNDVICAPFVSTLLKRRRETKIDIALVHLCDFRHSWTVGYVINKVTDKILM